MGILLDASSINVSYRFLFRVLYYSKAVQSSSFCRCLCLTLLEGNLTAVSGDQ